MQMQQDLSLVASMPVLYTEHFYLLFFISLMCLSTPVIYCNALIFVMLILFLQNLIARLCSSENPRTESPLRNCRRHEREDMD